MSPGELSRAAAAGRKRFVAVHAHFSRRHCDEARRIRVATGLEPWPRPRHSDKVGDLVVAGPLEAGLLGRHALPRRKARQPSVEAASASGCAVPRIGDAHHDPPRQTGLVGGAVVVARTRSQEAARGVRFARGRTQLQPARSPRQSTRHEPGTQRRHDVAARKFITPCRQVVPAHRNPGGSLRRRPQAAQCARPRMAGWPIPRQRRSRGGSAASNLGCGSGGSRARGQWSRVDAPACGWRRACAYPPARIDAPDGDRTAARPCGRSTYGKAVAWSRTSGPLRPAGGATLSAPWKWRCRSPHAGTSPLFAGEYRAWVAALGREPGGGARRAGGLRRPSARARSRQSTAKRTASVPAMRSRPSSSATRLHPVMP